MSGEPDFAAEGLLEGVDGSERDARIRLLTALHAEGCSLDALREATAAGRLALLPVERLLGERRRYSLADCARETGLSPDFLLRNHTAVGLPRPDGDTPVYDEHHIENLRVLGGMMEAGFPEDDILGSARVLGEASRRIAEGFIDGLSSAIVAPEDSVVQREAVGHVERATGRLSGGRDVAVAFTDLAGFTAWAERVDVDEVGALAARFEALVARHALVPVVLVKVLGDGAMLVSEDAGALLAAVLAIAAGAEEAGLPPVHAGVTHGPAVRSSGDWYGRTVNLAARLCGAAGPRTVLVTPELRAAAGDGFAYAEEPAVTVKGIEGPVPVLRAGVRPSRACDTLSQKLKAT